MKKMLIEKLDSFAAAPFTIQRISELLSDPRKQYSRIDKFMRAVEKTILVVSTTPPGRHRSESENGDSLDSGMNGDFASEVNVDVDMEQGESFAMTKELTVAANHKEPNHEANDIKKETIVTIIKSESPTKTDEEAVKPETTDEKLIIAKEEKTTIVDEDKQTVKKEETTDSQAISPTKAESPKDTTTEKAEVAPSQEATDAVSESEPKANDALPNEPIKSAENEILVDTSEIISETTPLAALENIVAIRTEPIADIDLTVVPPTIVNHEPETKESRDEVIVQAPPSVEEDSTTEAKRLKISEVPVNTPEIITPTEAEVQQLPVVVQSIVVASVETSTTESVVETEASSAVVNEEVPVVSPALEEFAVTAQLADEEKIEEPLPEIPLETVPASIQETAEPPSAAMETVPTITENKMSLDEDEPPAIELEMTPSVNKMDTDEAEAAPMDFEDDAEPMDQ